VPEGHSIHRLKRQFDSVFGGRRLSVSSPQGRFTAGAARLDGQIFTGSLAHGKQLFLRFDNELYLRVHLGLYGAWDFGGDETFRGASSIGAPRRIGEREIRDDGGTSPKAAGLASAGGYAGPPDPVGAVRARLVSDHGWADLRGPTACEVITGSELAAVIGRLGPDPLRPESDPAEFVRRVRTKGSPIGQLLMNQEIIAGVGNIYRAETLFRQGIDPWLPGKSLGEQKVLAMWADVVSLMEDGVRDGRIVTTAPRDRGNPAGPASAADAHYVYNRAGLGCRWCEAPVALAQMAARKLYWCPGCQN
jgi:endonuclease VIII